MGSGVLFTPSVSREDVDDECDGEEEDDEADDAADEDRGLEVHDKLRYLDAYIQVDGRLL